MNELPTWTVLALRDGTIARRLCVHVPRVGRRLQTPATLAGAGLAAAARIVFAAAAFRARTRFVQQDPPWRVGTTALILILTATAALGQFSTSIYLPSIPAMTEALQAPLAAVQLTLTVYLFALAAFQLVYGPLADRFGRRPVMLAGLTIFVVASLVGAFAPTIEVLIAARFFQGLGACAGLVLSRAIMRDAFAGPVLSRAMTYMGMAFALVPGSAPLLGGVLQDLFGWRAAFLVSTAAGVAVWLLVHRRIAESLRQRLETVHLLALVRAYGPVLRSRAFFAFALACCGIMGGLFGFLAGSPDVYIRHVGLSPSHYGIYPPIASTGFVAGGALTVRLSRRLDDAMMVRLGLATLTLAAVAMALLPALSALNAVTITACMWLYLAGMGMSLPTAIAGGIRQFPERAGTASALLGFLQMAGAATGTLIVARLGSALGVYAFPAGMLLFGGGALIAFLWLGAGMAVGCAPEGVPE
jgi:DHA1 family bicyclomycin/chloramphenicol resistance-like MFS transporter